MMPIMLDNQDETQIETPEEPQTDNEIIEEIKSNPHLQEGFSSLNRSSQVNLELAEEVLSILQEIENPLYDSDVEGNRYINWETDPIGYDILRGAGDSEIARMIKNKRRLDFMAFGTPPSNGIERGAKLSFINPDYSPSREEKAILKEWEMRIFSNFFYAANEKFANFGKFIGNAYEDYFDLDDITIEIRRNGLGTPVAIHLQDPIIYKPVVKKIRFSPFVGNDISGLLKNYEKLYDEELTEVRAAETPDYLLVYRNQRKAAATIDFVRKFHFFTRSKFQKAQRGYSITEQAIRMITYISNALKMNAVNFTNSRLPQGFFAFAGGGVNQTALERLKKVFWANQQGSGNNARFPMIAMKGEKADVKWVGVRNNSRDMEYHQFMTLLFSIFCQLSGTDPREVALGSYGDAVGKSKLFDDPTDGVRKESKDIGARTFLSHLADSLNSPNKYGKNVFQELCKLDVKLDFVGFEVEDQQKRLEITTKELATIRSVNDLLAEQDFDKQVLMLGDKNVYDIKGFNNPQIYQTVLFNAQQQAQKEQAQQQQMQQMQGMPQGGGEPEQGEPNNPESENNPEAGEANSSGKQDLTEDDMQLLQKYKDKADIDPELMQQMHGGGIK